jgi:ZIP family zinc transporter
LIAAVGWGALSASSLIIGALLGLARPWPGRLVGVVLAFGAGALISAVSFELAEEGARLGGADSLAVGLAAGALTYWGANRLVERTTGKRRGGPSSHGEQADAGPALALGALLDGIPEQAVLGIGIAAGGGVSVGLLAAIFISNLPEAVGSATAMAADGHPRGRIVRLWLVVAAVCVVATVAGYVIADAASGDLRAIIDGFAAGALLVMLIDAMIPEAARDAGDIAGLLAVLGFAVAAALSSVGP